MGVTGESALWPEEKFWADIRPWPNLGFEGLANAGLRLAVGFWDPDAGKTSA